MEAKLPVSESEVKNINNHTKILWTNILFHIDLQVRVTFTWQDAFDKGSLFGARKHS